MHPDGVTTVLQELSPYGDEHGLSRHAPEASAATGHPAGLSHQAARGSDQAVHRRRAKGRLRVEHVGANRRLLALLVPAPSSREAKGPPDEETLTVASASGGLAGRAGSSALDRAVHRRAADGEQLAQFERRVLATSPELDQVRFLRGLELGRLPA